MKGVDIVGAKVSIIMAAYNSASTIAESIESILQQTFTDWEFIICDDGSSDDTYRIIKDYEARYPGKIIAIRNEQNSKLPYSLNHCLQYANGEYIARMDADDKSYPERLEKQHAFLTAHPEIDVVAIHSQLTTEDVPAWLAARNFDLTFALDETGEVLAAFGGSDMLPQTAIIAPDGTITYNAVGSVTYEELVTLGETSF